MRKSGILFVAVSLLMVPFANAALTLTDTCICVNEDSTEFIARGV